MNPEEIKKYKQELEDAVNSNDRELALEKLEKLLNTEEIDISEEWMDGFFYLVSLFPKLYKEDDLEGRFDELVAYLSTNASPFYLRFMFYCSQMSKFFLENGFHEKCDMLCTVTEKMLYPILESQQDLTDKDYLNFYPAIANINEVFYNRQNFEKAIHWSETGVKVAEYFLSDNADIYLGAIHWLASIYFHSTNFNKAIDLLHPVLIESKFGVLEKQELTLALLNNLSQNMERINDAERITHVYSDLIGFYEKYPLQCRHFILTLKNDLARQYSRLGRPDLAVPLYMFVVSGRREDKDFPPKDFAVILASYGNMLLTLGQNDKAEVIIREVLDIRKEVEGENSALYARSLTALANIYNTTERNEKAEAIATQALGILKQNPENTSFIIEASTPLVHALKGQKKLDDAVKVTKEVLETLKNSNDKNLILQEIFLRSNLAEIYEELDKLTEAVEEDFTALTLFKNNFPKSTFGYSKLVNRPILALQNLRRFNEALPLINEAIELVFEKKGNEAAYIPYYYSKGVCFLHLGKTKESEAIFKECLILTEKYNGKKSREYIYTITNLLHIYLPSDRLDEAYKSATQALELAKEVYDPLNGNVLQLKSLYGSILFRLGKKKDSLEVYKDILESTNKIQRSIIVTYGEFIYQTAFTCYNEGNFEPAHFLFCRVREIQDTFLKPNDKRRNEINKVISQLEGQLDNELPDNFKPFTEFSDEEKAKHVDSFVYIRCFNAFLNEDFLLCIRLGQDCFFGLETSFLVVLSYLFLKQNEEAGKYGAIYEKLIPGCYPNMLYKLMMGVEKIEKCLEIAQNQREKCSFYMYKGAGLIAKGKIEEGMEDLNTAITFEEDEKEPYIEIIIARKILSNLKNTKGKNHPVEIENLLDKLYEQLKANKEKGIIEKVLKTSLEIRDWSYKLGKDHPSYGDALINLADSYIVLKNEVEANSLLKRGLDIMYDFFPAGHWELKKTGAQIYNYINAWYDKSDLKHKSKYNFTKRLLILLRKDQNEDFLIVALKNVLELSSTAYHKEIVEEILTICQVNPVFHALVKLTVFQISIEEVLKLCQTDRHRSMAHFLEAQRLVYFGKIRDALSPLNEVIRLKSKGIEEGSALHQKESIEKLLGTKDSKLETHSLVEELEKAFSFIANNQITKALEIANEIRTILEKEELVDKPITPKAYYELGLIYNQCSRPNDAIDILEQALTRFTREHSYYPLFLGSLGAIFLYRKDYGKAQPFLDEAYKLFIKKNDRDSLGYKDVMYSLLTLNLDSSNFKMAEEYCLEYVEACKVYTGETSQDYIAAIVRLAQIISYQGRFQDAENQAKKAFDLSKKIFGQSAEVTIYSMIVLSQVTFYNNPRLGEKQLNECVKLVMGNNISNSSNALNWINEIVKIFYENGKYSRSEELSREIIDKFSGDKKENNAEKYRFLKFLADSLHGQQQYKEALKCRHDVLKLAKEIHSAESNEFAQAMEMLALTHDALGNRKQADELFERSLNIIYQVNN